MADPYKRLKLPKRRVHVRNAGFLRRAAAFIADILILDLFVFGSFAAFFPTAIDDLFGIRVTPAMTTAMIAMALLALTYFTLFEYLFGQTPGMMLFRISAENVTLLKAFIRNLYFLPIFPFPFLLILEPLYLLWRRTRLLELLSGTRTVERITY